MHFRLTHKDAGWLVGLVGAVLGVFLWTMVRHGYVRAYSDPHNWLSYALNFHEQLFTSRWPYGFPLFLRGALFLLGPYFIFIINLPLLLIIFYQVWRIGSLTLPEGCRVQDLVTPAVVAFLLAVSADARNLIHYINPYRDPLAHVLLFGAMLLFIRAVKQVRPAGMIGAGALLGLACSVREPSILMLGPFLLYGLVAWDHTGIGSLRRMGWAMLVFTAAFGIALLPLAAQTYAATAQVLLPPQAALEAKVVPGAHFTWAMFLYTSSKGLAFYWANMPVLFLLAGVGTVVAVRNRQRELVALIIPAALVYGVFYSFYWTFVSRYFYIVTILLCLPAGYGVWALWRLLASLLPARVRPYAARFLVCGLAFFSARTLVKAPYQGGEFRISDARAFAERVAPVLPEDAVVFAPRHMCELLAVVVHRNSYPLPQAYDPAQDELESLREHLASLWAAGTPVYAAEILFPGQPVGDTARLRRVANMIPVATLDPADFRMKWYAPEPFTIYSVEPWRGTSASQQIERSRDAACTRLDLDLTALDQVRRAGHNVQFTICGRVWPLDEVDGPTLVLDVCDDLCPPGEGIRLAWSSDVNVPQALYAQTHEVDEPLDIWFDYHQPFDFRDSWRGNVLQATPGQTIPRLYGPASFIIPDGAAHHGGLFLEWRLRSASMQPGNVLSLNFLSDDVLVTNYKLPLDRRTFGVRMALPHQADGGRRVIRILPEEAGDTNRPLVEVHRLLIHRMGVEEDLDIQIGAMRDAPYVGDGFFRREGLRTKRPLRWMAAQGEIFLPVREINTDRMLVVEYDPGSIPESVRTADWFLEAELNGHLLVAEDDNPRQPTSQPAVTFVVPRDGLTLQNRLVLRVPGWTPRDHGGTDDRELGVQVRRVRFIRLPDEELGHD